MPMNSKSPDILSIRSFLLSQNWYFILFETPVHDKNN